MKKLVIAGAFVFAALVTVAQAPPACQATNPNSPPAVPPIPLTSPMVNVLTDCAGVAGDGSTDDWFALQSCINQNPGKHIVLPKTNAYPCDHSASSPWGAGDCATTNDYYVSQTLSLCGNAQWLSGEGPARYSGAVQINFAQGNSGPGIAIPWDCASCEVTDLSLYGNNCWNPKGAGLAAPAFGLLTYDPPQFTANYCATESKPGNVCGSTTPTTAYSGYGPDGLFVASTESTVERVHAQCFERHGFVLSGDNSAYACPEGVTYCNSVNGWSTRDNTAAGNRGWGLLVIGSDANAGASSRFITSGNQLGAIADYSTLGNSYYDPQSTGDNEGALGEGAYEQIGTVSTPSFSGVCTLTPLAGALGDNIPYMNMWVTVAGTTSSGGSGPPPGGADGTYRVTGVGPGGSYITYNCPSNTPASTGGNVFTASSAEVYAALPSFPAFTNGSDETGVLTGAYVSQVVGSPFVLWFNPYCEETSGAPIFGGASNMVVGARCQLLPTPNSAVQNWQQFFNGHLLGGTGLISDSRSAAGEVFSLVAGPPSAAAVTGPPAVAAVMTDQMWHEEFQWRGPDNYNNTGSTSYNSGSLWYDFFHGCSLDSNTPCSAAAPTHYFWLQQYSPPTGGAVNNAISISEAGDIAIATRGDDASPAINTLTLGNADSSGGTVVQGNLTANENLFIPGLLPPTAVVATSSVDATPFLYYVWANYANGASGAFAPSNLVYGNTDCPVEVNLKWPAVLGASSYTVYRQVLGFFEPSGSGIIATITPFEYESPPFLGGYMDNSTSCAADGSALPPYTPTEGVVQTNSLWFANFTLGTGGPVDFGWTAASVDGTVRNETQTACGFSSNDWYLSPGQRSDECTASIIADSSGNLYLAPQRGARVAMDNGFINTDGLGDLNVGYIDQPCGGGLGGHVCAFEFVGPLNGNANSASTIAGSSKGTTGDIGGSLLAAGDCAMGTASIPSIASVGQPCIAMPTDGSVPGLAPGLLTGAHFAVSAVGTTASIGATSGTATVYLCATAGGTPAIQKYNVTCP